MQVWDGALYRAVFPFPGLGSWDADVYLALARAAGGSVLELGCGTGRILSALLAAGLDADGLELDPSMRAAAIDRLHTDGHADASTRIHLADMRAFRLERRYASVLLPDNSLALLSDDADVLAMLSSVRTHLREGGELAFDHEFLDRAPPSHEWPAREVDVAGVRMRVETTGRYDPETRIYGVTATGTASAASPRRIELALRQRTPEEIARLLRDGGFRPRAPAVDERGKPVSSASHLMIGRFGPV